MLFIDSALMDFTSSTPLINANEKRIVARALKSRIPSVYSNREAVETGGLMYYGADVGDFYRQIYISATCEMLEIYTHVNRGSYR